jgi:hypothetical protein
VVVRCVGRRMRSGFAGLWVSYLAVRAWLGVLVLHESAVVQTRDNGTIAVGVVVQVDWQAGGGG